MDDTQQPQEGLSNFGAQQAKGDYLAHQLLGVEATDLTDYSTNYGLDYYDFSYTTTPTQFTYSKTLFNLDHVPLLYLWHVGFIDSANGNVKTQQCYRVSNDSLSWSKKRFDFTFTFSGAAAGQRRDYFYYMALPLNFAQSPRGQRL